MDINLFLLWCYFLDGCRTTRQSPLKFFLHDSFGLEKKLVENEFFFLESGEMDLRTSKTTTKSNNRNLEWNPVEAGFIVTKRNFVHRLVFRKSDTFLHLFSWSLNIKLINLQIRKENRMNILQGILASVPILVWICLILTNWLQTPDYIPILLSTIPILTLLTRFLLRSRVIIFYLARRLEFVLDIIVISTGIAFMGLSIGFSVKTIPFYVVLLLLSLDWRFSDSCVHPSFSFYHPAFFLPSLCSLMLLPALAYAGFIPVNFHLEFDIVSSHVTVNQTEDVFQMEYPPPSTLTKIRYSQAFLDSLVFFSLRLLLSWIQFYRTTSDESFQFDYFRTPIAFQDGKKSFAFQKEFPQTDTRRPSHKSKFETELFFPRSISRVVDYDENNNPSAENKFSSSIKS